MAAVAQAAVDIVAVVAAEKNHLIDSTLAVAAVAELVAAAGPVADHCYLDTYVLFL